MKHSVVFDRCENHWDNALPLGNGVFGGMVYYENNIMYLPLNHYEVYYNDKHPLLPTEEVELCKKLTNKWEPGLLHQQKLELAQGNQPVNGEPYSCYRVPRATANDPTQYEVGEMSAKHISTGDLQFVFADSLKGADSRLGLYVEDAKVELCLQQAEQKLSVETIVSREDCVVNRIYQNTPGLLDKIRISLEPYRDHDAPQVTFTQIDCCTFGYTVTWDVRVQRSICNDEKWEAVHSGILRLHGAKGRLTHTEFGATIVLEDAQETFYLLTGVFTQWRYSDTLSEGIAQMDKYEASLSQLYEQHSRYWKDFFAKSSISLPDPFLEKIYYINQYALDCCSGKDGIMKHHACGLNGLWDIRHPNLWGSMWYWDVNIQAAFAGVFSSNRLDLAKVFSDGLRCYEGWAEIWAKQHHNLPGFACDYPYSMYYSNWSWCAQYLWFLYEYSLDEEYLRNEAYPLFLKLSEFMAAAFQYDAETDTYFIYPDVSPEQGPLTHNSVITVACTKYLFRFTLEAARILKDENPILEKCAQVLAKLPDYPLSGPGIYGVHLKDSEDAPENMWIRHPSMLMPLFPIGEFDMDSDEKIIEIFSNSLDFLEDRCEIGIFGGSWLAAAAARLGRGQTALRLLYERGIDHMLRSNGLSAEETERFMNYCLICRQPLYYPCMMEFTGEMLSAVNEMLLQSHNGIIRVFPALPDGDPEYGRMHRHGYRINDYYDRYRSYDAWETVSFDKLLAKGAFEVSAALKDGKLQNIVIHSKKGGCVRLTCPYLTEKHMVYKDGSPVAFTAVNGVLSFETEAGCVYVISEDAERELLKDEPQGYDAGFLSRSTYTKRNIFIGENPDVSYHKALDGFLRSWYLGNVRMDNHTVYKFDFGSVPDKAYWKFLPRQAYVAEEMGIESVGFSFIGEDTLPFTAKRGYGFANCDDITAVDRKVPEDLRRDFVQGSEETEFIIEAPRGQYELLVISGDAEEDSVTILDTVNGWHTGDEVVTKGRYQCKLIPLIQERDIPIRLKISTKPGYRWKLNALFLNVIKGY